jgi:predicted RNase H-like HicB family nuclease
MTYQAIFDRAEDGTIWGRIPEIPGAYGSGATIDEARESLIAGVRIHIEELRREGLQVPAPTTLAVVPINLDAA